MSEYQCTGAICAPKTERMESKQRRVAWCFNCRKRLTHKLVILYAEWWGATPKWECEGCGQDHMDFPGTVREWYWEGEE